jgi:aminopeptidase
MQGRFICVAAVLLAIATTACNDASSSDRTPAKAPPASVVPDLEAIAANIVNQAANVRPGEKVLIEGGVRDLELLENLATEVAKAGGAPLLTVNSERMLRGHFDGVDAKYDSTRSLWSSGVAREADVVILVDFLETPNLLGHVPPERRAKFASGRLAGQELMVERGVRQIEVGNNMYPTHARASRFGLSRDELAAFFWGALQASPDQIRANGERLQRLLADARELHVTDPHGTDLRVSLSGKQVFVSDGASTPERVRSGQLETYLPAGEVYTQASPEGATGVVATDRLPFQGGFIENFRVRVEKGRIAGFDGSEGIEAFREFYDAYPEGKEPLSVVNFGVNPGLKATASSQLRTWVPEGMFSVMFGNDLWAGGSNNSSFLFSLSIPDATVKVDDVVVIENGALKLP